MWTIFWNSLLWQVTILKYITTCIYANLKCCLCPWFFMSKLFQHSLWYCCSLFWLSKYSLGNFSHWNVFDSVMEHFRISLYEWWNMFDRKKWCRKFSVENFGVENFPSLTVEHFPLLMNPFVENFLSKMVCFPLKKNTEKIYNLISHKVVEAARKNLLLQA